MIRVRVYLLCSLALIASTSCGRSTTLALPGAWGGAPVPPSIDLMNILRSPGSVLSLTGNGGPSGSHFNLNIIGTGSKSNSCSSGGRIFVPLSGSAKINLSEGPFQVLDCNGTDGTAAFQLPNPDPTNSGSTTYSVFARALGKPGGSSSTTTCATDTATGDLYCSVYSYVAVRTSGKQSFTNVSKYLLYLYADINADGVLERYPLFDTALQDYYWQYDNNGLRLLQLRFYPISTNVN